MRKGLVLAGGAGTRLHPVTRVVCKQLLPIYDKPLVYFPISTLMLSGIRDIMVISTPHDQAAFQHLLGSGEQWGLHFSYEVQQAPQGLAQAFTIGRRFIDRDGCALVLGDNIFYGHHIRTDLRRAFERAHGATIFGYRVSDPERYGVVEFDDRGNAISLEEKPATPRSNHAVTGLYFYDNSVVDIAAAVRPSARGELEITDVNRRYLQTGALHVERLGRGYAWFDAGTHESLMQASEFIRTLQRRQGLQIACPEEIAYRLGYIDADQLLRLAAPLAKTDYGRYLRQVPEESGPRDWATVN